MKIGNNTGACELCGKSLVGLRTDARYCSHRCGQIVIKRKRRLRLGVFARGTVRKCVVCCAEFKADSSRHIYCSDACNRTACQKRRNVGLPPRRCTICDKEFQPNSSQHLKCSKACKSVRHRQLRLASKYGLTTGMFTELLRKQGGGCAICKTNGSTTRWAVDHDHSCCLGDKTCGKCIRGILCYPCNQALGLMKDSPEIIASALVYINTNSNLPGQPGSDYQ